MRRGTRPRSAAVGATALVLTLSLLAPRAAAADWLAQWPWAWSTPRDPKMAEVVAALRAEEARYRDVEYVARITARDVQRQDRSSGSEVTTMARRRVVVQGDRTYLRHESFERVGATKVRHEETSACDGERTRTIVAGNCANIHLGRWRHPRLLPAHSLPLAHHEVNFPLSIYLGGTRSIHAYLAYPRGLVNILSGLTFRKVETAFEGEEEVDGLRCLKVRADRWYNDNSPPLTQHLWLAPGRNYHCIREESRFGTQRQSMRVDELREVTPGVWFPAKISVVVSQQNAPAPAKPFEMSRTETTVEQVVLAPRHEAAFFRDVAIPAGLPVFTIKDRRLVGSILPEPLDDDWGRRNLADLAARVAEQERRYDDTEVKARTLRSYPTRPTAIQSIRSDELSEERSILRGGRAYLASRQRTALPGGWQDTLVQTFADDGEWARNFRRQGSPESLQGSMLLLSRGNAKGARGYAMHRPHRLILRNNWGVAWLSDLLAPSPELPPGQSPFRFRYCGAAEVDGRPCIEIRGDPPQGNFNGGQSAVLYLATDRNQIPIRVEYYAHYSGQPPIPAGLSHCGDFREIAPGLWYPFRVTEYSFGPWELLREGWMLLESRNETTVELARTAPRIGDDLFRDVRVTAGVMIQVTDEAGQSLGLLQLPDEGVPWLPLKRYLELSSRAQVDRGVQPARRRAPDSPIGRPAPEFPRGAAWLGGRPPTRESLRGRVVVLAFWAEWSDPCREVLERLNRLQRDGDKDGPVIIGVHPRGSEPAEIARAIDTLSLGFPTCVDVPAAEGSSAWGELFGRLAVRAVPRVAVVDADGKIVAIGRLEDVLVEARGLIREDRTRPAERAGK